METLQTINHLFPSTGLRCDYSNEETLRLKCEVVNKSRGDETDEGKAWVAQTGYQCGKCLNKGYTARVVDMAIVACPCECRVIRKSLRNIAESGLSEQLERFTLETFRTETPLQEEVKTKAQAFLAAPTGRWFYAGGQVGCGKTHICTAITGELLKQGKSARYMLWRDDSVKIKACVNDAAEYNALVEPLKNVDVLYIDDFLKTGGNNPPTTADVNLAFEIINHRILYERKITVISSEYSLDKILEIDEALGSRIYQRAKEFSVYIGKGACKNWRLR